MEVFQPSNRDGFSLGLQLQKWAFSTLLSGRHISCCLTDWRGLHLHKLQSERWCQDLTCCSSPAGSSACSYLNSGNVSLMTSSQPSRRPDIIGSNPEELSRGSVPDSTFGHPCPGTQIYPALLPSSTNTCPTYLLYHLAVHTCTLLYYLAVHITFSTYFSWWVVWVTIAVSWLWSRSNTQEQTLKAKLLVPDLKVNRLMNRTISYTIKNPNGELFTYTPSGKVKPSLHCTLTLNTNQDTFGSIVLFNHWLFSQHILQWLFETLKSRLFCCTLQRVVVSAVKSPAHVSTKQLFELLFSSQAIQHCKNTPTLQHGFLVQVESHCSMFYHKPRQRTLLQNQATNGKLQKSNKRNWYWHALKAMQSIKGYICVLPY